MQKSVSNKVDEYTKEHFVQKRWKKVLLVLSCIVVFCTTYALILPAITMTDDPICGFEEHVHDDSCFEKIITPGKLDCKFKIHEHSKDCHDENGNLICGLADYVLHEHNEKCYDEKGELVCPLPEVFEHEHTDACFEESVTLICKLEEDENHSHTDECKKTVKKLICQKDEIVFHEHTDACRSENGALSCGKTEVLRHTHDDSCFSESTSETVLTCEKVEHQHDEVKCYPQETTKAEYVCGFAEHSHGDDCFDSNGKLVCSVPEHTHTYLCLEKQEQEETTEAKQQDATEATPQENTNASTENETTQAAEDFDISKLCVFKITAKLKEGSLAPEKKSKVKRAPRSGELDIRDYLDENGGEYTISIINADKTPIKPDDNGNYVVAPNQKYQLTLGFSSPNGIATGTYTYTLPQGITVNDGNGGLVVDGVSLGSWSVDTAGKITLIFNEEAGKYSNVSINAMMGISFSEEFSSINFDGKISLVVKKPPEEISYGIEKYSDKFIRDASDNREHIHWIVTATSGNTSLVGKTLTDTAVKSQKLGDNHKYTDYDKENGIHFIGTAPDETRYEWIAYGGGDGLTWGDDEHSWSYVIPETITTVDGRTIKPGEGWKYVADFTTTVTDTIDYGWAIYQNNVQIGKKSADGWAEQRRGNVIDKLIKKGVLNDRTVHWTINQVLSGGSKYWYFWDYMLIYGKDGKLLPSDGKFVPATLGVNGSFAANVPKNVKVTVVRNGTEYTAVDAFNNQVPNPADGPSYAFKVIPNGEGFGWAFYICTPCTCVENSTCFKNRCFTSSEGGHADVVNGWCPCWDETEDVSVNIEYDSDVSLAIENYGGVGNYLKNTMEMYRNDSFLTNDDADIIIPGVFKKELRQDPEAYNGYIASYTITANEAKLDLSNLDHLLMVDTMSDTLVYVPGTMVITAEDKNSAVRTLELDKDYSLEYLPDEHKININVINPKAEKYTLKYDAQIVVPKGATTVNYSNSAYVELFGKSISSETTEKVVTNISVTAKRYYVTVHKIDSSSKAALPGATFELHTENGEVVAAKTTNANGDLTFETNVNEGVVLKEHLIYYVLETKTPDGYIPESKKRLIVFCDEADNCAQCKEISAANPGILRVPANKGVTFEVENTPTSYVLPATGSIGTIWFTMGGSLLIAGSLLYKFSLRRKKKGGKK